MRQHRRPQLAALVAEHDRTAAAARTAHVTGDTAELDRLAARYADVRHAWRDRMTAELKVLHGDTLQPGRVRIDLATSWLRTVETHWPAYRAAVHGLDQETTKVPSDPWPDQPDGQLRWLAATPTAEAWLTADPAELTARHTEVRTAMHGPDPQPERTIPLTKRRTRKALA